MLESVLPANAASMPPAQDRDKKRVQGVSQTPLAIMPVVCLQIIHIVV